MVNFDCKSGIVYLLYNIGKLFWITTNLYWQNIDHRACIFYSNGDDQHSKSSELLAVFFWDMLGYLANYDAMYIDMLVATKLRVYLKTVLNYNFLLDYILINNWYERVDDNLLAINHVTIDKHIILGQNEAKKNKK